MLLVTALQPVVTQHQQGIRLTGQAANEPLPFSKTAQSFGGHQPVGRPVKSLYLRQFSASRIVADSKGGNPQGLTRMRLQQNIAHRGQRQAFGNTGDIAGSSVSVIFR